MGYILTNVEGVFFQVFKIENTYYFDCFLVDNKQFMLVVIGVHKIE